MVNVGTNSAEPLVSIICTTYNHENYIRLALQSFVEQEAPFDFEVVVGDDCSRDKTPEIVREFEKRYPNIVRAVYHSVNQYSQGKSVSEPLIRMARGKYIALCEGDDYWIDREKLAKQILYMEAHPDCTFCFSNARMLDNATGKFLDRPMLPQTMQDSQVLARGHDLKTPEILKMLFLPTASFVYRKACWERRPIFPAGTFMGDRYLQMVMTEFGYAHYVDEVTCVYRVNNPNSVMGGWARSREKEISSVMGYVNLYREFDAYTEGRYTETIKPLLEEREYRLYSLNGDYKRLRAPELREYAKNLGQKSRLVYFMRTTFPRIAGILDTKFGKR